MVTEFLVSHPNRIAARRTPLLALSLFGAIVTSAPAAAQEPRHEPSFAVPNDNRSPAGVLRGAVLELDLEARPARWAGENSILSEQPTDPSVVAILGFAEEGGPVRIPGPLIRVPQGTEVRIRVRNSIPDTVSIGLPAPGLREAGTASMTESALIIHGLRAGTAVTDTVHVGRDRVREVRYRATKPGTYFYWATPSSRPIRSWTGRDAQLAGAIVVDPEGETPDPEERIFIITMIDQFPDSLSALSQEELFRRAINGRSWPKTERLHYSLGDTVRWRWINASFESHPMHLHGFHYRLLARGNSGSETLFPTEEQPMIVTEHMEPGATFRMEWVPTRAGNWIFHCHFLDHIVPAIERDEDDRSHDLRNVEHHALEAMAGLVLGISVIDDGDSEPQSIPHRPFRLIAMEERRDDGGVARGFALQTGETFSSTLPSIPGPPLLLTRGESTEITVVNRLSEPTTIHWHGLELESVFDGVAGWGRTGERVAPLIAPGDSFTVRIAPPRSGTFMYHTHMDETDQLAQGMAGPFLVLDPDEQFDPETDRVFLIAGQGEGVYPVTINGDRTPSPQQFRVGVPYRLRFIHITRGLPVDIALERGGVALRWRALAKDGADLPPVLQAESESRFSTHTGETFDFEWTPEEIGETTLYVRYQPFSGGGRVSLEQTFQVR